jgi:hypothetical protein
MGYNGGDVIVNALGNFPSIMVAFIHQNGKVSTPKFSFASKRAPKALRSLRFMV